MKIKKWMRKNGYTYRTLADELGCSVTIVFKLAHEEWEAQFMHKMKKLIDLSNGEITWEDIYNSSIDGKKEKKNAATR